MSGITESVIINGTFRSETLSNLADAFPIVYPRAMCPTANVDCFSS